MLASQLGDLRNAGVSRLFESHALQLLAAEIKRATAQTWPLLRGFVERLRCLTKDRECPLGLW